MNRVRVGSRVVFRKADDAAVFKVVHVEGFMLGIVDVTMPKSAVQYSAVQYMDKSLAYPANVKQIANSK